MVLEDELSSLNRELCMFPTRAFEFKNAGTVVIEQDVADVGSVVWDAEVLMAHYLDLAYGPRLLHGRRVVEIGAGTGLAGIVAARLGASVLLTDQAKLLPTLINNAHSNAADLDLCRYPSTQSPLPAETRILPPPFSSTESCLTPESPLSSETLLPRPPSLPAETLSPPASPLFVETPCRSLPSCMETRRPTPPPRYEETDCTSSSPLSVETHRPERRLSPPSWRIRSAQKSESRDEVAVVAVPASETEEGELAPSAGSGSSAAEHTSVRRLRKASLQNHRYGNVETEGLDGSRGVGDCSGVDRNRPFGEDSLRLSEVGDGAGGDDDRGGGGSWRVAELLFSSRVVKDDEEEIFRSVSAVAGREGLFDLVLAADVVYLRDLWDAMAVTIKALLKPTGEALMTFEQRRSNVDEFFGPPRFGGGGMSCANDQNKNKKCCSDDKRQNHQRRQLDDHISWDRWGEIDLEGDLEIASRASRIRLFRMTRRTVSRADTPPHEHA